MLTTAIVLYMAIALLTFGHLCRYGSNSLPHRLLHVGMAAGWPVYWPIVRGVRSSLRVLRKTLEELAAIAVLLWCMGVPFFPAYYLYHHWEWTGSVSDASIIVIKALVWAVFWPAYAVAVAC